MTATSPPQTHAQFLQQRHFASLDGIRALSIVAVVWHHTRPELASTVAGFGFLGVDLFFVVSGFLIVTLLLREREVHGRISLSDFYARRFLRLFPLYYGLLALLSLFALLRPGGATGPDWFSQLPFLLLYLANWVEITSIMRIAWSLAAEEQFYLLWPPIEKFARRFAVPVLLAAAIASQLIQFGVLDGLMAKLGFGASEPSMLRETTFFPILLGVLLAHVLHVPRGFSLMRRLLGSRQAAPLVLLALLGVLAVAPADIRGWARPTIQVLMFLFLAACVVREDHGLAGLLRVPLLQRIGAISYGIYLLHLIARHFVLAAATSVAGPGAEWILFPGTLLLSLLLAELSFRCYETPFLRMKSRFSRPRNRDSGKVRS